MADSKREVEQIQALIKERVRLRREQGIYDAETERLLQLPLPGGPPILKDELEDPISGVRDILATEYVYDPRSRRRYVGPLITLARRGAMWILRWWIKGMQERQDRINRLALQALDDLAARPSPRFSERLAALERAEERRRGDETAAQLELQPFAERFSGAPEVIRRQAEPFVKLFRDCRRVLDLGSGRGAFLELMRDEGIGAYGVDIDRDMVELCKRKGLEAVVGDAEEHLRGLEEGALDGIFSAHVAEHIAPGKLIEVLRQCRRVLKPGSAIVMATPNPSTLTVGANTFWLDPSHRRPIPSDLFKFYLETEGFTDVDVVTYARTETRLNEDVPEGAIRDNVRLLNKTLFGDRDYAVTGRAP